MAILAHRKREMPNSRNKLAYTYQMALLKLFHINDLYYCQKLSAHPTSKCSAHSSDVAFSRKVARHWVFLFLKSRDMMQSI